MKPSRTPKEPSSTYKLRKANILSVAEFLLCAIACQAVAGCGGVMKVTRAKPITPEVQKLEACKPERNKPCDLPGVPFYVVGYRCQHTTVWLQPVYLVTFSVTSSDGKPIPSLTRFLGRREFEDENVQSILSAIKINSTGLVAVDQYQSLLDGFRGIKGFNPVSFDPMKILIPGSAEEKEVLLVSNSVVPERYVDAKTVYFYNVNKPFVGSANAEIDLNNEGILSKVSGQSEDKTLPTILSALPTSDLIKTAAGIGAAGVELRPTPPGEPVKYKVDLQVQTRIYKHTRSSTDSTQIPPCTATPALVGANGATNFNFTVEDITTPPKAPAATEKPVASLGGTGAPEKAPPK
jgi:hypothetical protein